MSDLIHQFMETADGRSLGVKIDGVSVLVQPNGKDNQARAREVAEAIADNEQALAALRMKLRATECEVARTTRLLELKQGVIDEYHRKMSAALTGRRRFLSAVLLKPATADNWTGPVWLMDPVKQEKGLALRFDSLREVHEAHPELWIVGSDATGILLDGWSES